MDGFTTNYKLQFILDMHPSDITLLLKRMCQEGYLKASGIGKGTRYELNVASKISGNVASLVGKSKNSRSIQLYNDILAVCQKFEPLSSIAPRVKRNLRYLKNSVIPEMVAKGLLIRKYPDTPSHPDQQYKARQKE